MMIHLVGLTMLSIKLLHKNQIIYIVRRAIKINFLGEVSMTSRKRMISVISGEIASTDSWNETATLTNERRGFRSS